MKAEQDHDEKWRRRKRGRGEVGERGGAKGGEGGKK